MQEAWAAEKPGFVLAIDKSESMGNSFSDVQRAVVGFIREMRAGEVDELEWEMEGLMKELQSR